MSIVEFDISRYPPLYPCAEEETESAEQSQPQFVSFELIFLSDISVTYSSFLTDADMVSHNSFVFSLIYGLWSHCRH
jgi:hypothetical protein